MDSRDQIVEKLRHICYSYTDILGRVILFGSYSRDEAQSGSDIDLYIEPKNPEMTTARFGASKRYKSFKYDLYDAFPVEFDLLAYGGKRDLSNMRKSPLWKQIEKDGVLIYDQKTEAKRVYRNLQEKCLMRSWRWNRNSCIISENSGKCIFYSKFRI